MCGNTIRYHPLAITFGNLEVGRGEGGRAVRGGESVICK